MECGLTDAWDWVKYWAIHTNSIIEDNDGEPVWVDTGENVVESGKRDMLEYHALVKETKE